MRRISYSSHTADIRMKAEAETLEELFRASLEGMGNLLKKNICRKQKKEMLRITVHLHSVDKTALLIDFLSEVLTQSHTNHAVYYSLDVVRLTENDFEGTVFGSAVDFFDEDIKAVTYHEAEIIRNKINRWETTIIFDI